MNDRRGLFLLGSVGLILLFGQSAAAKEILLGEDVSGSRIGRQLRYFEDAFAAQTICTVFRSGIQSQFLPSKEESPGFGYAQSAYWFKAEFRSSTSETRKWFSWPKNFSSFVSAIFNLNSTMPKFPESDAAQKR